MVTKGMIMKGVYYGIFFICDKARIKVPKISKGFEICQVMNFALF
jgi:hypothetical protein